MLVLIVANWATLTNTMKRTFSSPEKYYQWVEKNTVKDAAASVASIYSSYLLVPSEKKTIFVEDDFEDYVEDIADMDADDVMEELEYLMWDLMYYMY